MRSVVARLFPLLLLVTLASCSATRFLKDDQCLLDGVAVKSDKRLEKISDLEGYVRQHPNSKWFSLFKVPLGVYCISGTDSTRRINRFFRRLGEAPVIYDSVLAERSRADIQAAVRNLGYLNAEVAVETRRKGRRAKVQYEIHPAQLYTVSKLHRRIDDAVLDSIYLAHEQESLLDEGMPFDVNLLDGERSRLSSLMLNSGFYRFNKSFVRFEADTTLNNHHVDLTLNVSKYRTRTGDTLQAHQRYHIGNVNYLVNLTPQELRSGSVDADSVVTSDGGRFFYTGKLPLAPSFLRSKSSLSSGQLFQESDVQSTYGNLSSLSAVMSTAVTMDPVASAPDTLNATVSLFTAKRHAVSFELEGTNSAGDFGAAVSLGYQNRNLFRRSAQFGLTLRGAFEAIKGLEGYSDQNFLEFSAEANLNFPDFIFPFLSQAFRRTVKAQSIASIMFESQDRPEFHRRVLTAAWRYRWNRYNLKRQHRVDLLDLNYVFMPWISETFNREYPSDNGSRNAVLRYNYENLFIMKWGYVFQYTSLPPTSQSSSYGKNAYSLRLGVETAGNLLYGISHLVHGQYSDNLGAYTLFNIAYAEYVKFDFDFAKSFRFDDRNSLGLHFAFGVAVPYGNSRVLPYEKRYFSGGANSVRGWSVRGLGPGRFMGSDGRVDFIRQTGDVKLDLSAEWRSHLFWKIDGGVFVDAGNVWTLRDYEEQPGGQFRFGDFWRQIAVAYGLGFRLNFGYFILRLDGGMKAINPGYEHGRLRYPLIHPSFKRDFQLHFAVGLPY